MNCKYCGKECKNNNSLAQHEIRCNNNPNKIKLPPSNFIKYNELLRIGQIQKINSNQFVKAKNLGLPKPIISQETREKLAKGMKGKKTFYQDS